MLEVIRYLKGYLEIRVWGFSPERFMNLCSNHGIFLWDVTNCGDHYRMKLCLKDFYRLKGITRKTGTRVAITKRYGLPFLSVSMWKRRIFLLGLLGSLGFWILMSGFIWAIEISGNYYVTEDVLMDFLEQNQIRTGMRKKGIDLELLEENLRTEFPVITWTSTKIDGTKLKIQIKENDVGMEPGISEQEEGGKDLVADRDGLIVNMVTRNGVPVVKVGMEVKKGDILVEGGVPIMGEDGAVVRYDFCTADADVYLQSVYSIEEKQKERYEKKFYSGREKRRYFLLSREKELAFPFLPGSYEQYDVIKETKQLRIFKNYELPVFWGKETRREYETKEQIYTKEEIKEIFQGKLQKFIATLEEKGVQIIEKNVTINKTSGVWSMKTDFLTVEKTGVLSSTHLTNEEPKLPDTEE